MKKIALELNRMKSEMYKEVSGIFEKYIPLVQTDDARKHLEAEKDFFNTMSSYFKRNTDPFPDPQIIKEMNRDESGFQIFLMMHLGTKSPDARKLNEMMKEIHETKEPYREKINNLFYS